MNDKKIISNMLLQAKKNYSIAKTEHWLNFFSYRIETLELVLAEIEKHSFFNRLINFFQKMRSKANNGEFERIRTFL